MVCLEPREKMPASVEEIAEAEEEGTKITCGYGPKEFIAENGHVTAVVLKKCTILSCVILIAPTSTLISASFRSWIASVLVISGATGFLLKPPVSIRI